MKLPTLSDFLRGDSPWLIEGLLAKGQSMILSGTDPKANSLLALQLALDVASGKDFLGQFPTLGGSVLFLDLDKAQLRRNAEALNRKQDATEKIVLEPEGCRDLIALVRDEKPDLTVVNLGQREELWNSLSAIGAMLVVAGGSWNGIVNLPVWTLNAKADGYALHLRSKEIAVNLAKRENGFSVEGIEALKPGTPPKFDNRDVRPMRPWATGINLERREPVISYPQIDF